MKTWHMFLCMGLVVATIVLIAVGADVLAIVPAAACALMMGAMVWMMVRMGHHHGGGG